MQDDMGTHVEWKHIGITPNMVDWLWSNIEKVFLLCHPEENEILQWAIPPMHGNPIGSIHIAPQTLSDGISKNVYLRFERLETLPYEVKEYIVYEHVAVFAVTGFEEKALQSPKIIGYRIHQWQKTDYGVEGISSSIGIEKEVSKEEGLLWSEYCIKEVENWDVFLPQLYSFYGIVKNTKNNPYSDLTVEGKGSRLKYKYIK